jgi:hypothetical protein
MDVKIKLGVDDWKAFQVFLGTEIPRKHYSGWVSGTINFIVWFVIAIIVMATIDSVSTFHWPTAVTVISLFVILIFNHLINRPKLLLKSFEPELNGSFCGEHSFVLDKTHLMASGVGYESKYSWSLFQRVVKTNDLILLFIDNAKAFVFPINELNNPEEFFDYASQCINEYKPFKQDK